MINTKDFISYLEVKEVDFFVGVPDSLLKDLTSQIYENAVSSKRLITANEGNAISVASGYALATNKIPAVFMQNSGLGNCINPLTSLTNKEVYSIPMILLIGWRGEPSTKDEPQHILPGQILQKQLDLINVPNFIIDCDSNFRDVVDKAINKAKLIQSPVAIIFKKNSFQKYKSKKINNLNSAFTRKQAIETILLNSNKDDYFLSTTGKASRELYEIRKNNKDKIKDFMTVGSMGHVSSIALGIDIGKKVKDKNIICIDGDGSFLMHMGAMAILGCNKSSNMKYFLLNNGVHDSVGGQETVGFKIDFCKIAEACNFEAIFKCSDKIELKNAMHSKEYNNSPSFLEIIVGTEKTDNLMRPQESPIENKESFMQHLRDIY